MALGGPAGKRRSRPGRSLVSPRKTVQLRPGGDARGSRCPCRRRPPCSSTCSCSAGRGGPGPLRQCRARESGDARPVRPVGRADPRLIAALARPCLVGAQRGRLVRPLPGAGRAARRARAATRLRRGRAGQVRGPGGPRLDGAALMEPRLPTDDLDALARAAQVSKMAAAALRWLAACAVAFAGLLLLSLGLALFERSGEEEPADVSASAYLDFDLSVLRALADGNLRGEAVGPALWSRRPDWQLPKARHETAQLASLRDAWTAATSDKSRFRTAARGARDALPFLLCGLALAFLAAAAAGMLPHGRRAGVGRLAQIAGACLLVAFPLWAMLDPAVFYDRTRSVGLGFSPAPFVGAFAR